MNKKPVCKSVRYAVFVCAVFVPAAAAAFILGGIDAVAGTSLSDKFGSFIERLAQRVRK